MPIPSKPSNRRALAMRLGIVCALLQGLTTSCTYVYKTEMRRGALLRTEPIGRPEATGTVSLALTSEIQSDHDLNLAVSRRVERRRPVRKEYERCKVEYGVQRTGEGIVSGELAAVLTGGLAHLIFWDWHL